MPDKQKAWNYFFMLATDEASRVNIEELPMLLVNTYKTDFDVYFYVCRNFVISDISGSS